MPSFLPAMKTTDATPTVLGAGPFIPADSVCRVPCYVFASDHNGNVGLWYWLVAVRRVGSAAIGILLGTPDVKKTAGASLWTATLVVEDNHFIAQISGGVGQTIDWLFMNEDALCMEGEL